MCVLAKLIGSTGNVRIISRKIEILCQDSEMSVSDPVILLQTPLAYCMMSTLLLIFNAYKMSQETQKGHFWKPNCTYDTV